MYPMIGSIKGKIIHKSIDKKGSFLIIETNGIGYKIWISSENLQKLKKGKESFFYIHTHIREDAFNLYGFLNYEELEFFEMLINVSGIGPKGALIILGIASIETMQKAINTGDVAYLTKISGIGKKTAEKIIIELRDKIEKKEIGGTLKDELDALEALKSLGYSQNEAREALKKIPQEMDTTSKIKEALKNLGK